MEMHIQNILNILSDFSSFFIFFLSAKGSVWHLHMLSHLVRSSEEVVYVCHFAFNMAPFVLVVTVRFKKKAVHMSSLVTRSDTEGNAILPS